MKKKPKIKTITYFGAPGTNAAKMSTLKRPTFVGKISKKK
jgi:hypothetical protein